MRLKRTAIILCVVMAFGLIVIFFAQGKVGPASIIHKEVAYLLGSSASRSNAVIVSSSRIPPESIQLPWLLSAKIAAKQAYWLLAWGHKVQEFGEEYLVRDQENGTESRCLIRVFGDYVVGIVVAPKHPNQMLSDRLRAALLQDFPNYTILVGEHA